MTDPRSEPTKVNGFVVGDLAFFMLDEFGIVPFEEVLPDHVRKSLPERGVFAYFEWVQLPGKRKELQGRIRRYLGRPVTE